MSFTPRRIGWFAFAEDLPAEAARVVRRLVVPRVLRERGTRTADLERMCGRAESHHRPTTIDVVDDVLHLAVRELLEAGGNDEQIGRLQRLEARDVRTAGFDEAGRGIRGDERARAGSASSDRYS
jgi:hypothetical protein